MYAHVLTIGCTGMLREAAVALAGRCRVLTSVARTHRSLRALDEMIASLDCKHCMLPLDWSHPDGFAAAIAEHISRTSDPDLVLAWLHQDALGPGLAKALAPVGKPCAFFQARGSTVANPADSANELPPDQAIPSSIDYHQIILGFHNDKNVSRWLYDSEICAGVLDAIDHPQAVRIVGTVQPWSNHP